MTPKAKGSYFKSKHVEQATLSYIHFIKMPKPSQGNTTWDIVLLPAGKKPILVMAVLKSKPDEGGGDDTFYVCYVAEGHKQAEGVNYSEMFATAAKIPSFRVVLGNATQEDWEIHQVDVKSVYLNVPLEETMYMLPPLGVL